MSPLPHVPDAGGLVAPVPDERLVACHRTSSWRGRDARVGGLHHDRIVYERYFNGGAPTRLETSISVSKSSASTLVGLAIDELAIHGIDDPITRYLPELARRDPRFARIRIRDLLTMSSGLHYTEGGWPSGAMTRSPTTASTCARSLANAPMTSRARGLPSRAEAAHRMARRYGNSAAHAPTR